jgi:hypothetical protein
VQRKPTSTYGKPVLDEATFQQLLAAAHVLQEHNARLLMKEPQADGLRPNPMGPLTSEPVAVPHSVRPLGPVLRLAEVESLAPRHDSVIPPETAYQLFVLAFQLEAMLQGKMRSDSQGGNPQAPVITEEKKVREHSPESSETDMVTAAVVAQDTFGRSNTAVASPGEPAQNTHLPGAA